MPVVTVMVIEVDRMGRVNVSRRAVLKGLDVATAVREAAAQHVPQQPRVRAGVGRGELKAEGGGQVLVPVELQGAHGGGDEQKRPPQPVGERHQGKGQRQDTQIEDASNCVDVIGQE